MNPASDDPARQNPGPSAGVARIGARGVRRWIRWTLLSLSVLHFVTVVCGLLWMHRLGETHWITATLLFVPPAYWALPLFALAPPSWVLSRGACAWQAATAAFVLAFFLPSGKSPSNGPGGRSLVVVDNNLGQRKVGTLLTLVGNVRPDLVVLQEVSTELGARLRRGGLLGTHFAQQDEFVVAGRYPVVRSGLVERPWFRGGPVAAWFELDVEGEVLVVYVVHLPTPRPDFYLLRGNGFFKGLVRGGGVYSPRVRETYREMLSRRVAVAEELAAVLGAEVRPFLVVGDFNAPGPGYVRRIFATRWTDVFAAAGRGYGLTFPGVTRNPLSLFGPWLRLDYIFAGPGIRPVDCWVEPREPAQHRALVARLELPPATPAVSPP